MTALRKPDGEVIVVRARSMVGLLPVFASVRPQCVAVGGAAELPRAGPLVHGQRASVPAPSRRYFAHGEPPELVCLVDKPRFQTAVRADARRAGVPVVRSGCVRSRASILNIRSFSIWTEARRASTTSRRNRRRPQFGGNSNWRGPIWFPLNFLALQSLRALHQWFGRRFHGRIADGLWPERPSRRRGG